MSEAVELPFFAGKEIPVEYLNSYFFNRKKEIKELCWKLEKKPALNIAIYGQRRLGKTSLIQKLGVELRKKDCLPILIKCEELIPLDELTFMQNLTIKILEEYSKVRKLVRTEEKFKEIISKTKIGLEIADITFWLEFGKGKVTLKEAMDKCFDLINKIARKKKKVVIFLDEFQELFGFGDKFLWALRAKIANSKASFVVSSSWHRFKEEITNEKRPFFNFFDSYEIKEVNKEEARVYLMKRAKKFNLHFDLGVIDKILSYSQCKPYYLQLIALKCYTLSLDKNKKVNEKIYEQAVKETIRSIPAHLSAQFEKLKGHNKEVFAALCIWDLHKPAQIAEKVKIEPKNVVVILNRLIHDGLVNKSGKGEYEVVDYFLKEYVKSEYM